MISNTLDIDFIHGDIHGLRNYIVQQMNTITFHHFDALRYPCIKLEEVMSKAY